MNIKDNPKSIHEALEAPECMEEVLELCGEITTSPELGYGELPTLCTAEKYFNLFVSKLTIIGALLLFSIAVMILIDVTGRMLFDLPFEGVTDFEALFMCCIGFSGMTYAIVCRQSLQIDLLYLSMRSVTQRRLHFLGMLIGSSIALIMGYCSIETGLSWTKSSPMLQIQEWPFVLMTGIILLLCGIAFLFQAIHAIKTLLKDKDFIGITCIVATVIFLWALPFVYKSTGIQISSLLLGTIGFALLMTLMLLRVPLGWAMCFVGLLGLFLFVRRPSSALSTLGHIPFSNTASFIMIAFPMFMLMGEMAFHSGLSSDLFNAANKWLGRLPGGLAVASIGGCAGFGAVCGDSMATVITMSSVAMEPMREKGYSMQLATGAIAAGGTLGILIPPSMGFIIYSMITEESIGKLFVAGLLPGVLLTIIFMGIIVFQVKRHPSWAPPSAHFTLQEKLHSLLGLIPVVILFGIVVGGILYGKFTPGEGGAIGAMLALFYAIARRKMTFKLFLETIVKSASMFGKMFILFVGLYVFGAFLSSSRLPNLLSDFIIGMEVNRYIVLLAIIFLYICLGCVMNIIPMMMLTLPSLFPTVQALGFDGVWFGVITVIVMEMGMITPPVGMNVFTMASLHPDIPLSTIFKGVLPFFLGMIFCTIIVIIFPELALFLPSLSE